MMGNLIDQHMKNLHLPQGFPLPHKSDFISVASDQSVHM